MLEDRVVMPDPASAVLVRKQASTGGLTADSSSQPAAAHNSL